MKRFLNFLFFSLVCVFYANSNEYEIDGIYYNRLSDKEVEVTFQGTNYWNAYHANYSGEVVIPDSVNIYGRIYKVTSIGNYAFYDCTSLNRIVMPNSLREIGCSSFEGCISLSEVVFGDSVKSIGDRAFLRCNSLTRIKLPNGLKSIGDQAFTDCTSLSEIEIPNSVTHIGSYVFKGCAIKDIVIPESVSTISAGMFQQCVFLKSVIIPQWVDSIGDFAFDLCANLENIVIPNSVVSIGKYTINRCPKLSNVIIHNSVQSIGDNPFGDCDIKSLWITGEGEWHNARLSCNVSSLIIESGITSVNRLKVKADTIYCFAENPPTSNNYTFTDYGAILHVPATSLAKYFVSPYWSNFANIVGDAVEPLSLDLDKNSVVLAVGEQMHLSAYVEPTNCYPNDVIWHSTNNSIITIDNGLISTVGVGECDVIAYIGQHLAVCHVQVVNPYLSFDKELAEVLPNHMITLTPTSSIGSISNLYVASSNSDVAVPRLMNGIVQVVGISEGTAVISVHSNDENVTPGHCVVTVYTETGDLDCDGYITISDVVELIDYLLYRNDSNIKLDNADLDRDGNVSIGDVVAIIDYLLNS